MTALAALLCSAPDDAGPVRGHLTENVLGISDEELLGTLRHGDEAMFERLYRTFRPRLVAIATAYVGQAVAEEIAQDVLMHVWTHRDRWDPQHGVAVYLYAAARNRALKQLKHQGIAGRLESTMASAGGDAIAMGNVSLAPDELVERDDLLAAVERALARLPELGRTAFTLRWIHQLAYAEVAAIMAISEPAVRKQVSRARESLLSVLRDHGSG